jgi:hypothetical protein
MMLTKSLGGMIVPVPIVGAVLTVLLRARAVLDFSAHGAIMSCYTVSRSLHFK